ncbi:thiamine-repressible mitochondrial transport protein THI74 [Rhizophagus irregularis]|uniref:Thiamine-repressible mitochondrial transport protein THI74 n=2 Tax=Rhizophagus irregularis TaxID=588596 RepID=A0A2N0PLR0_9GLOM|nr:thiamine-repressible mitochondrial transport protein THI74 [Rhizophagus irregularis]PKC72397.1 thiamine-repressible mitochondrial transport protein THI74 [Rhizophagus irregularis]CAB4474720.1 unnamed protein product [Rhizophagus irregularis]CAB5182367.1 unnamed protein product [Rhizophagus irregularis]
MYFTERHRYAIGILTLLCVVFIWVGSSFLMNNIFANQKYNKPFVITYTCTASFSLYLLYFICNKKRHIDKQRMTNFNTALYDVLSRSSSERSLNSNDGMNESQENIMLQPTLSHNNNNHPHIDPHDVLSSMHDEEKLTTRQVAELGFTFCILWFAANWSTNASIAYTSVASSTILSSTSGLFTLIIGSLFGVEKFTLIKLAAVLISIFGVFLISNGDEFSSDEPGDDIPTNPLFGNLLALMGAFFYGCYTILLKLRIQNESHVNMPLFFGFVGIFNVILLSPIFPLLHFTGLEQFELPPNITIWTMIAINALIGTFLSDYLWLLAVLLTSPLTATLGLSLTIPIALIGDIFFKGLVMSKEYWLGVFMIVGGFLCVNF